MVKSLISLRDLKGKTPFLGLTGGIGSGKSSVAEMLSKRGAWIVDTDHIAHQITSHNGSAIEDILKTFGEGFVNSDGSLYRAKMRELVFKDLSAKQQLEAITHPLIREKTIEEAKKGLLSKAPYLVFVVPLLVESGTWTENLDHIAVVDCDEELQIKRVMERSKLSREAVTSIMANQAKRDERLKIADTVLNNSGDLVTLEGEVNRLHHKMLNL